MYNNKKNIKKATNINLQGDVMNLILPPRGQRRPAGLQIWDEGSHMFNVNQHVSPAGNLYYQGVRVTDRFAIVEDIGRSNTFCYINAIELYAYDGNECQLISRCILKKVYYDAELIRQKTEEMMHDFLKSQFKMLNRVLDEADLKAKSSALIDSSYRSMLNEDSAELVAQLTPLLPKQTTFIDL